MSIDSEIRYDAPAHRMTDAPNVKPPRCRKWLAVAGILLGLLLLGQMVAFYNAPSLLTRDSGPVKGDVIIVLGGGSSERSERAAELFREGAAPRIIITGEGDCETNFELLLAGGVPKDAIEIECNAESTRQNALFTLPMLQKDGAHRVILVTTWYHSKRALSCFRRYAPGIEFYSRPSLYAIQRSERRHNAIAVWKELWKIPGYWICYGVKPW